MKIETMDPSRNYSECEANREIQKKYHEFHHEKVRFLLCMLATSNNFEKGQLPI